MTSKAKTYDMEIRDMILECLQISLRHGHQDLAKHFGGESVRLKERIASHYYSELDEMYRATDKVIKQVVEFQKWLASKEDWFLTSDMVKVRREGGKLLAIE